MAQRYLIVIAHDDAKGVALQAAIQSRTGLQAHISIGPLRIMTNEARSQQILDIEHGAIIGKVFHRHGAGPAIRELSPQSQAAIAREPAGELIRRYWGSYVAAWIEGARVCVLRDPSGLLPCYYVTSSEFTALASDAPLLVEAGLARPSIDFSSLARILYANELPLAETAISDVSDLLAGSAIDVAAEGSSVRSVWSPWEFVSYDPELDAEAHAARLQRIVETCSRGWAATYSNGLLALSGGLDSSIVASCLCGAIELGCLTISTSDPRGDERHYAQILCSELSLDLSSGNYALDDADILRSAAAHLPRPGGRAQLLAYDAVVMREMNARSADAFFTGSGGDNVFHFTHSARPLVDRYLSAGLNFGLVETLHHISQLTGASIWEVMRYALRVPRRRGPKYRWQQDGQFLAAELTKALEERPLTHPWLREPDTSLPGKAAHIAMITRAQHYLHGYDRRLPFTAVHPLVSQPIVETALSIPSWFACEGGVDRATARRAFSPRLPNAIIQRRLKGGPDSFAIQILEKALVTARERLLDGVLSSKGMLDRPALEAALHADRLSHGTNYVRLLLLLDTEAWIDAWTDRSSVRQARTA